MLHFVPCRLSAHSQHFRPLARAAPPVLAFRQVLALRPPVQALACLT